MVAVVLADDRNVTVVNGTAMASNSLLQQPRRFRLVGQRARKVLPNGDSVYVKFNSADKGCKWNFRIDWLTPAIPE